WLYREGWDVGDPPGPPLSGLEPRDNSRADSRLTPSDPLNYASLRSNEGYEGDQAGFFHPLPGEVDVGLCEGGDPPFQPKVSETRDLSEAIGAVHLRREVGELAVLATRPQNLPVDEPAKESLPRLAGRVLVVEWYLVFPGSRVTKRGQPFLYRQPRSARREVPDICYRPHSLRRGLPDRLNLHPDAHVLRPDSAQEVQYPHPLRGTVNFNHRDKDGILPPARVDVYIAD